MAKNDIKIKMGIIDKFKMMQRDIYLLLFIDRSIYISEMPASTYHLLDNGIIVLTNRGYELSDYGKFIISSIVVNDTQKNSVKLSDFVDLATRLRELYPEGKKDGTNSYWRDSINLICKRLSAFKSRFGDYSDETIYNATKAYVESFSDDKTYMRTLPYFIIKDNESLLTTIIDNIDSVKKNNELWTAKLC